MPVLILNMVILLTIFYFLDRKAYQKDIAMGLMPEIKEGEPLIRLSLIHILVSRWRMAMMAIIILGLTVIQMCIRDRDRTGKGIMV